jgi:hypothetical protein
MPWNHLRLIVAYEFAEVHGTQGLDDEIKRMQCFTWGKAESRERRGLTVEIFQKHQMLEELLEVETLYRYRLSRAAIQKIIDRLYLPKARAWKKENPQVWSEIQGCN